MNRREIDTQRIAITRRVLELTQKQIERLQKTDAPDSLRLLERQATSKRLAEHIQSLTLSLAGDDK